MASDISICGADCSVCGCFGTLCKGCNFHEGRVFHAPEGKACPIYACAAEEHGYKSCAQCAKRPCAVWQSTRDPSLSDAEFEKTIQDRLANLRAVSNARYQCALLAVQDVERSKKFYGELFNQHVVLDLGANVTFSGGFAIQQDFSWLTGIPEDEIHAKSNNAELYFEVQNFDAFLALLAAHPEVQLLHPPKTHDWKQRVVRLYDPDFHLIEVGESMAVIARRLLDEGLSVEETAAQIQHPVAFVRAVAENKL